MKVNRKTGNDEENGNLFQKSKYEVVTLRIKNKFYDKTDVLEKVVNEILKKEIISNT